MLVSRDRPHVELFNRVADEWSGLKVLDGLDAVLALDAIGVSVPLSAIYRRVFPS